MFDPFCIESRHGPHVTMQAGVEHAGRYWTSTARSSFKARALLARPAASLVRVAEEGHTLLSGQVTVMDPTQPGVLLDDPRGAVGSGVAIARLGAAHLQQLVGYVEASSSIPQDWIPIGRILLSLQVERSLVLDDAGDVRATTGSWVGADAPFEVLEPAEADQRSTRRRRPWWSDAVPPDVAALLDRPQPAWVGLSTHDGPVVVPGHWDPRTGATLPTALAAVVGPHLPGPVCVTVDESHERRPDRKLGAIVRGCGRVVSLTGGELTVSVDAERVTHWVGFESGTLTRGRG